MTDQPCPCGTGRPYAECCRPLHEGGAAPSAEALMRSRFTAYALGLADYLRATWHPSTRPAHLDLDDDLTWRRLQVVDTAPGVVEFRASYRSPDGAGHLHERSRFVQEDGRWFYVDGDQIT